MSREIKCSIGITIAAALSAFLWVLAIYGLLHSLIAFIEFASGRGSSAEVGVVLTLLASVILLADVAVLVRTRRPPMKAPEVVNPA